MLLAPSVLAADMSDLRTAVQQCEDGGADFLHVDVMDGHFVPNLTMGIPVIRGLAGATEIPLDVHLMVDNPAELLDEYLEAGASWLSVHYEASTHLDRLLDRIRDKGGKAGVALNPATPVAVLEDVLGRTDFVLLMSVNPGFAGQSFLPYVLGKAKRLRNMIEARGANVEIAMDGGIDTGNIRDAAVSGVEFCVAGSAVFGAPDPAEAIRELRRRATAVSA